MADVSPSAQSLVKFIKAYTSTVSTAVKFLPRWDARQPIVKYPGPQFELELKLVGYLLDVKAALDFEAELAEAKEASTEASRRTFDPESMATRLAEERGISHTDERFQSILVEAKGLLDDDAEAARNKVASLKSAPLVGDIRAIVSDYELNGLMSAAKALHELRPRVVRELTEKPVGARPSQEVKRRPVSSVKPLSCEDQEVLASLPPLVGRTDRQIIEEDGLTPEVLSWGGMKLGGLIELYDFIEGERRHFRMHFEDLPAPERAKAFQKGEDSLRMLMKEKISPCTKRLEEISHLLYGADLNPETLRRMRGKISQDHPDARADLDRLPLPAVEILLRSRAEIT